MVYLSSIGNLTNWYPYDTFHLLYFNVIFESMSTKGLESETRFHDLPKSVRYGVGVILGIPFSLLGAAVGFGIFEGVEFALGNESEFDVGLPEIVAALVGFGLAAKYYYR